MVYDSTEVEIRGIGIATLKPPSCDLSLKVFRLVSRLLSQKEDLLPSEAPSEVFKKGNTESDFKINLSMQGINKVLNALLILLQSEELDRLVRQCVNGYITTEDKQIILLNPIEFNKHFASAEYRESYYPVLYQVMLLAITPFTKGLLRLLGALEKIIPDKEQAKEVNETEI